MSLGFKGPLDLTLQLFQIAFIGSNGGQAYFSKLDSSIYSNSTFRVYRLQ